MFVNVYKRVPYQMPYFKCASALSFVFRSCFFSCLSINVAHVRIGWVHYLAAMAFDLLALCLSSFFVLAHAPRPMRLGCGLRGASRAVYEQGVLGIVNKCREFGPSFTLGKTSVHCIGLSRLRLREVSECRHLIST